MGRGSKNINILRKIKIVATDEKLTDGAGLGTLIELFDRSVLAGEFKKCLPERTSHRSLGSYPMALTMLASFIYGHDCLDDLDEFRKDPALKELFASPTAAARTHGDFLRDFEPEHIAKLSEFLNFMARHVFTLFQSQLPPEYKPQSLIIDIDSTSHVQHGEKMEGLAWNYKNEWCLDSQVSYNSMGLCHGLQLRPGNTKSGVEAAALIRQSFLDGRYQIHRRLKQLDFFRADSAYCTQDVIKTCLELGTLFTITAHDGLTKWKTHMAKASLDWQPWVYPDEVLKKAERQKIALPRVEIARFHFTPKWSETDESKLVFPILVKRTWNPEKENETKKDKQSALFFGDGFDHEDPWDHYAVLTNFPLKVPSLELSPNFNVDNSNEKEKQKTWSIQEVFEFHQKRGQAENFIKEEKYGFDLKHFPCQSLSANHAYGLLAMVAHNVLRWVAVMTKPEKPHYAKKIRRQFIHLPAKIVRHARQVFMKLMTHHYAEVQRIRERLELNSETSLQRRSSA
jgi:hypothetical protein